MTIKAFPLVPLVLVAACSSTATRFWTIEPIAAVAPPTARPGLPIQIAAVHVPLAFDRLEVVQHDVANQVQVLDFDRWSAPPGDLLRRALTQDLVTLLPPGSVIFPDAPAPLTTRAVVVDILALRQSADRLEMQLSWSVAGKPTTPHQLTLSAPAAPGDVAAQTEALGRMTGELAGHIVAELPR